MSKLEVDAIEPQSGTTLTIGASGDSVNIASGASLTSANPMVFPAGTASLPAITTTGDLNTGMFFPAADTIAFSEGGTEAMRINSSGNVGINTSSPLGTLEVVGSSIIGDYYAVDTGLNQFEDFEICRFTLSRSGAGTVRAFSGTVNFNVSVYRATPQNLQNNVSVLAHIFLGGFPRTSSTTNLSADIQTISTATNQPETTGSGSLTITLVAEGSDDGGSTWTTLTNNSGVSASSASGILVRIRANLTGTTPTSFNGNFKCFSSISGACNDSIVLSSTTISTI